jgi:hypothetical protein
VWGRRVVVVSATTTNTPPPADIPWRYVELALMTDVAEVLLCLGRHHII